MVCVGKDITERKRSEEMLLDLNDRLQRSNRDLQDFASVASHDLQAPLRKISLFSERLKSENSDSPNSTNSIINGIEFLSRFGIIDFTVSSSLSTFLSEFLYSFSDEFNIKSV